MNFTIFIKAKDILKLLLRTFVEKSDNPKQFISGLKNCPLTAVRAFYCSSIN